MSIPDESARVRKVRPSASRWVRKMSPLLVEHESLGPCGIPGQLPLSRGALERGAVADGSVASSGNDLLGTQAGPVLNPIQISVRISHSGEKELRPGRRGVAPHRRRELIASRRMDKLHATQSNRID